MIKVAVVGLGKMGLSHLRDGQCASRRAARRRLRLLQLCPRRSEEVHGCHDVHRLRDHAGRVPTSMPCVIATPSQLSREHGPRRARTSACTCSARSPSRSTATGRGALTALAHDRGLVTQVGYHNRFVGAFAEVKRLLDAGAIGDVTHVLGEAYGPVVLKPQGRNVAQPKDRGRRVPLRLCRACHQSGQLVPRRAGGCRRHGPQQRVLARDRRRGASSTLYYPKGRDGADLGQLVRRVLSQDDHPHHRSGARQVESSPIARNARSICETPQLLPPATSTAGTCATRPS